MAQLHLYLCHFFGGPEGHSSPYTEQQCEYFHNQSISGYKTHLNITLNEFKPVK
jgi:hypothetical protein